MFAYVHSQIPSQFTLLIVRWVLRIAKQPGIQFQYALIQNIFEIMTLGHTIDESSPKLKTDTKDIQDPLFIRILFTHVFTVLRYIENVHHYAGR